MTLDDASQVTRILHRAEAGDRAALDELLPLVYDQLQRDAEQRILGERPDHTLDASASGARAVPASGGRSAAPIGHRPIRVPTLG